MLLFFIHANYTYQSMMVKGTIEVKRINQRCVIHEVFKRFDALLGKIALATFHIYLAGQIGGMVVFFFR